MFLKFLNSLKFLSTSEAFYMYWFFSLCGDKNTNATRNVKFIYFEQIMHLCIYAKL